MSDTRGAGSPRLLLALVAATGVGLLGSNTMPLFVGSLIEELGIDEAAIGLLASLELSGVALGALALAPWAARVSRRRSSLAGLAIASAGYLVTASAEALWLFGAARFVAGIGCGVVIAAGSAAGAAVDEPDKLFARVALIGGLLAALLLGGLPSAISAWGFTGGYLVLVAICFAVAPFLARMPPLPETLRSGGSGPLPHPVLGVVALAALAMFWVADQALWTFTERIGISVGLTPEQVGGVLALGTVLGLVGAVAAALLGVRLGRTLPLVAGLASMTAVRVWLVNTDSPSAYAAAQLAWATTFLFTTPYTAGLTAALDRGGRWAAASGGVGMAGTAIGPAPAGYLMATGGPSALAWFLLATSLVPVIVLLPVSIRLGREPVD